MNASPHCPTCKAPLAEGICRHCAFSNALLGMNADPFSPGVEDSPLAGAPNGFELLHEIGRGGTAVVWLARERKLNRLVALKLIALSSDPRLAHRLVREGQAIARLQHPHIVTVHTLGTNDHHA